MKTVERILSQRRGSYVAGKVQIAVVGAGHAGIEAALATARLGLNTLLVTLSLESIANLPCNPSIGGTAKGQLVREIDALGGEMGKAADRQMIQFRMLNRSKGPAVLSPRSQIDRKAYQADLKSVLEAEPNIKLIQGEVVSLVGDAKDDSKQVIGVALKTGAVWLADATIITTGTYLNSRIIIGEAIYKSGPDGLNAATELSESLLELGLPLRRFKTGTPSRLRRRSLNFVSLTEQPGDADVRPFSYENDDKEGWLPKAARSCWLTWTSEATRQVITENIHRSPLYSGEIKGIGPRYCPSIEDKVIRFPEHERHHVFVEPTGLDNDEMYASGLSSSLPEEVQVALLRTIPGFENIEVSRIGYAIEYDCIDPQVLRPTLEVQGAKGLYLAGQINGSSGYEEAAGQGLIAGINAARRLMAKPEVIIRRDQGYLGVLIDDLVTKGTDEPYRLMTSRAEYRLLLRQDNADLRLTPLGYEIGLISQKRYDNFNKKQEQIRAEIARASSTRLVDLAILNPILLQANTSEVKQPPLLSELLKRPQVSYDMLHDADPTRPDLGRSITEAVEVEIKYEGYITVEKARLEKYYSLENQAIAPDFDFATISGLRLEAIQKLTQLKPASLGQASRIPGVTPADIQVLQIAITSHKKRQNQTNLENGQT